MKHTFWKAVNTRTVRDAIRHMDDWGSGIYEMFIIGVGPCYDQEGQVVDNYITVKIWGAEFPKQREETWC